MLVMGSDVGVGTYVGFGFTCGFERNCSPSSPSCNIGSDVVADDGVRIVISEPRVWLVYFLSIIGGAVANGLSDA